MFIQNFTCFSTLTSLSKNRQGNVNSFCIVQFSRSFFNSSSLSDDFVIISHLFVFVKRFLKNFFIFFELFSNSEKVTFFSKAYLLYHIFSSLSRGFLNFFRKFFVIFKLSAPHLWRLVYYITFFIICQPFSTKKSKKI